MSTKVLRVDTVELRLLKSKPPQLLVVAHGTASTPGWENPELLLLEKVPEDGIYEFDFCAEPPTGIVPQIIVPITATFNFKNIPPDLKGVRINASTNSIEQNTGIETTTENTPENVEFQPYLETIMGIEIIDDLLKIRVPSGGCTTKDSLRINVIKGFTGVPPYFLEIYRVVPDSCRAFLPNGTVLEYKLPELGIEPFANFTLINKIGKSMR